MSNNATVENLNKALQMEMSAAHQYQLHAHVLDDWGLNLLADKMREFDQHLRRQQGRRPALPLR